MTTDAQRLANKKYYAKVREERMEVMRKRAKERTAERIEYLKAHPEEVEALREKAMDKYYKGIVSANKKRIAGWLEDPDICDAFKEFLRQNVLPVIEKGLPKKFLDMCWEHLAIVNAVKSQETIPGVPVDGTTS